MAKSIPDSFPQEAETDLRVARVLLNEVLFSQLLYIIEQALEKKHQITTATEAG